MFSNVQVSSTDLYITVVRIFHLEGIRLVCERTALISQIFKLKLQKTHRQLRYFCNKERMFSCLVWFLAQRGKTPNPANECPRYDTKQSDGVVPVILELWEMQSTPSLPSLPASLLPRVVALDSVLSMGQIELNRVFMLN